jgi:acyl-CoA synthetase (AMP-forming)/AMP-acid ligase II
MQGYGHNKTGGGKPMSGLMMNRQLTITSLMEHARKFHGDAGIVSVTADEPLHRCTYREAFARSARLANALARLGIRPGERIGTLAWNDRRGPPRPPRVFVPHKPAVTSRSVSSGTPRIADLRRSGFRADASAEGLVAASRAYVIPPGIGGEPRCATPSTTKR